MAQPALQWTVCLVLLWSAVVAGKPRVDGDGARPHHRRHERHRHEAAVVSAHSLNVTSLDRLAPTEHSLVDTDNLDPNCSACLLRAEAKHARIEQIKRDLLEKLGFGQRPPSVNATRDLPPLPFRNYVAELNGYQADSPAVPYHVDDDDDNSAVTEKVYSFARPPPDASSLASDEQAAFFDFSTETMASTVEGATLHVYMRQPREPVQDTKAQLRVDIYYRSSGGKLEKAKSIKRSNMRRDGFWVEVPFKPVVKRWFDKPSHNLGITVNASWHGENLAVHPQDGDMTHNMYVEIETTEGDKSSRKRRNAGLDCTVERDEQRCCRYPLVIDFEEFEWDWVIAPKKYQAYYCNGVCPYKYLQRYLHSHVVYEQLQADGRQNGSTGPCCYPTSFAPITMVYLNDQHEVLVSKVPAMVATRCGCA